MTDVNIFVAFAAGVFSFLSPCVLPLIPSYLSFVSGVSLDEMRSEQARARVRWRVILNSVAFIIGFSLVFISLGASASFLGGLFLGYRNTIRILGGVFILLVGLYLVGAIQDRCARSIFAVQSQGQAGGLSRFDSCRHHFRRGLDTLRGTDPGSHAGSGQHRR